MIFAMVYYFILFYCTVTFISMIFMKNKNIIVY